MRRGNAARFISACVWVAAFALLALPAVAADVVTKGTRTVSLQKSFDDVTYGYDITFSAQIAPAKHD